MSILVGEPSPKKGERRAPMAPWLLQGLGLELYYAIVDGVLGIVVCDVGSLDPGIGFDVGASYLMLL